MLLSGCAKVPFKPQEPLADASLVYIYVVEHDGFVEANRKPSYKVAINGKKTDGGIMVQEYKAFDLKPTAIEFGISRADIEIQKIDLNLQAGQTYYLRVKSHSDDFGKFEVVHVKDAVGAKEIQKMYLAGAYEADRNKAITELILPEKEAKQTVIVQESKTSKTEELEKAYALKEKGILSEEEFTKLKQEILAK
jgi:hypothetical protein